MKTVLLIGLVVASGLIAVYLYNKYYKVYQIAASNPTATHAVEAGNRYIQDIAGLIHGAQAASQQGGDFGSRLGSFINALPGA